MSQSDASLPNSGAIKKWGIVLFLAITAVTSRADLDTGLVAFFPFNGNAHDDSGNENNGIVHGATPTTDRFGNANSAYYFDGSSYIEVPRSGSLEPPNEITVTAWVKTDENSQTWNQVLSKRFAWTQAPYNSYIICEAAPHENPKHWAFGTCDQSRIRTVSDAEPLVPGQWVFLAGTYDGSQTALYVNGRLESQTPGSGHIEYTSLPLLIGTTGVSGQYMKGAIDDIRIYNRALSATEVRVLSGGVAGQVPLPPQKIFLAFDEPSSFRLLAPTAFGRSWPIEDPFGSMPAASVDASYRSSVTAQLKSIFSRSGINNIDWVLTDSDDAIVVYFCPLINPDILGKSRGQPDRFNSKRRGEVIVFVNESYPLASLDAESAAHEIGHSLGLRHVDPSSADPHNNEVMDLDFSSNPQFINAVSDVTDIASFSTHNPLYHLLRYVDGWSPAQLQNEGIEPGTWDLGTSSLTKLTFQGSNLRLHNITLYASGGEFESTFILDQISSATLSELSQRTFTIPTGMAVTLLASSAEGGVPDVISATGDPFVAENQHVAADNVMTQFSLYRQDSPTAAVSIASATAESDLTTPYCNIALTPPNILRLDFRGTLQQSSNLSDWADVGPDTTSPQLIVIPPDQKAGYFRSKQPVSP